jgi:organic hydroperoxide reductase OsmC/OhrA
VSYVIEAEGLRKRFGTTTALDGVDLAARRGTVLGVLGPRRVIPAPLPVPVALPHTARLRRPAAPAAGEARDPETVISRSAPRTRSGPRIATCTRPLCHARRSGTRRISAVGPRAPHYRFDMATHRYELTVRWTGDTGSGTSSYRSYRRDHEMAAAGKPSIAGSADPAFRGDPQRWSPEELLVASLSQCHMLWFLHLAAVGHVVVNSYVDNPTGVLTEDADGSGAFSEVMLRPQVTVADPGMIDSVAGLHGRAHELCFIARSVSFPVRHEPSTTSVS